MNTSKLNIVDNFKHLASEVAKLAQQNNYNHKINIVAVTKTVPVSLIEKAYNSGITCFAENYIQEAEAKYFTLKQNYGDKLQLSLIGQLQRNKVAKALQLFDTIATIDSIKLIDRIKTVMQNQSKVCTKRFYLQVNCSSFFGDSLVKRGGVNLNELHQLAAYAKQQNLNVVGLMGVADPRYDIKKQFMLLKQQQIDLALPVLSMGMSSDYKTAISCGSNELRIGSSLFGARA